MNTSKNKFSSIVSQCERALKSGATFKDFADYTCGIGDARATIQSIRELNRAGLVPDGYTFSGDRFSCDDFRMFKYALPSNIKFSVSEDTIRYWGEISDINLNHIANFSPKWLERTCSVLRDRSISGCILPEGCDLRDIDLSGCKARNTDFSVAIMHPEQLLTLSNPIQIKIPKDMSLAELNGVGVNILAKSITANNGWTLSEKNIENTDLSVLDDLNLGKLFSSIANFKGTIFPRYKWKNPEDTAYNAYEYDDISGCAFYNCDLSGIYNMPYSATKNAYFENCKPPLGISLPEPDFYR